MGFDVIVIGSGFGGSVAAARLSERGLRVLILERGPFWGPLQRDRPAEDRRELPRGVRGASRLVRNVRIARNKGRTEKLWRADGLLELHRFEHLNAVTGSGVGGGSHLYTAILETPPAAFFDAYPPEVTLDELRADFARVRQMLRPGPVRGRPDKVRVFADAAHAAGLPPVTYPELAIVSGDDPDRPEEVKNAAGVAQHTSSWRGDAFVGCEDGSKTTLDLTYVPVALNNGAELSPLCEVLSIAHDGDYVVGYLDHRTQERRTERAPRVVLAAGGLNTQRLLFAARDAHGGLPAISRQLGQRFSPNGDFGALVWRARALEDSSRGPSFGALSRVQRDGAFRFLIGDVGVPADALPLPAMLRRWARRSTALFCMGPDASNGAMGFDGEGLVSSVGRSLDEELYAEMADCVARVAKHYAPRRVWSKFPTLGREGLFTVHPLGGCAMARGPDEGVTDHLGQVFGHPGLYVADGSLYPRSPGIPPSMTIAALAERQARLMS